MDNDYRTIEELFKHHLGLFAEDVQHKFELVIEGQQALSERMERMENGIRADIARVESGVSAVAAGLSVHRRDGEAHSRYQIGED